VAEFDQVGQSQLCCMMMVEKDVGDPFELAMANLCDARERRRFCQQGYLL